MILSIAPTWLALGTEFYAGVVAYWYIFLAIGYLGYKQYLNWKEGKSKGSKLK